MRKYLSFFILIFMANVALQSPAIAGSKLRAIYNPPTMSLDGDSSKGAVAEAISRAAANRDWRIKRLGKSTLKATYKKTGRVGVVYKVVLTITYSKNKIDMKYRGSRDLNYQKESQLIDGHYNNWVKKLEKEIWKEVNR